MLCTQGQTLSSQTEGKTVLGLAARSHGLDAQAVASRLKGSLKKCGPARVSQRVGLGFKRHARTVFEGEGRPHLTLGVGSVGVLVALVAVVIRAAKYARVVVSGVKLGAVQLERDRTRLHYLEREVLVSYHPHQLLGKRGQRQRGTDGQGRALGDGAGELGAGLGRGFRAHGHSSHYQQGKREGQVHG